MLKMNSYRFLAEGASIIVINKTDSSETNISNFFHTNRTFHSIFFQTACQMKLEVDFSRMINVSNGRIELNLQAEAPFYLKSPNCTLSASGLLTIPMKVTSFSQWCMLTWSIVRKSDHKLHFYAYNYYHCELLLHRTDCQAYNLEPFRREEGRKLFHGSYTKYFLWWLKYSILSIGFSTIWDAYICFSHLNIALMRDVIWSITIMSATFFLELVPSIYHANLPFLRAVFSLRYEATRWAMETPLRALLSGNYLPITSKYEFLLLQTNEQLRRGIMAFNIKFCNSTIVFR